MPHLTYNTRAVDTNVKSNIACADNHVSNTAERVQWTNAPHKLTYNTFGIKKNKRNIRVVINKLAFNWKKWNADSQSSNITVYSIVWLVFRIFCGIKTQWLIYGMILQLPEPSKMSTGILWWNVWHIYCFFSHYSFNLCRYMNITMSSVVFFDQQGKMHLMDNFFVLARNVKYIQIPKEVIPHRFLLFEFKFAFLSQKSDTLF